MKHTITFTSQDLENNKPIKLDETSFYGIDQNSKTVGVIQFKNEMMYFDEVPYSFDGENGSFTYETDNDGLVVFTGTLPDHVETSAIKSIEIKEPEEIEGV